MKTRFTEEQMVTIVRKADRKPVAEVAKKHGIADQTIYAWRRRYGTLEAADVKRQRQREQEDGRLKKMVADRHSLKSQLPKKRRARQAADYGRRCARYIVHVRCVL
jgi:transposase-like protein